MPLSRDFRGFTSLLLSDNVCWQCRIQLQQRSHSLKIFSLRNGASEERMKAIAPKNGVCTKKAKRFLGTETRPGKFRMRHSKEAAGRLQSRNRARKSKLEDDAWLLPSKGLLSAPGDEAYIISKLAPAIGIPKAKVQVCLQAPGTTNPQIPGSPPLVSNPSRFNPRSFKAHSAKEATWNALSRKHPLRQGSLGICTSKVGRRSYGTASAAMNTVSGIVRGNSYVADLDRIILPRAKMFLTRVSSFTFSEIILRSSISAKDYKIGKKNMDNLCKIQILWSLSRTEVQQEVCKIPSLDQFRSSGHLILLLGSKILRTPTQLITLKTMFQTLEKTRFFYVKGTL